MSVVQIVLISIILLTFSILIIKISKLRLEKIDWVLIFSGAAILTLCSFLITKLKIGGTVLYSSHGWPHFFAMRRIRDVIDGNYMNQWVFLPGEFFSYPLSNFIFYFSCLLLIAVITKKLSSRFKFSKKWEMAVVLLITLLFIVGFLNSDKFKEQYIKAAIEKAKYCEIDSDCVDAGSKCPFGCYAYVNKNERARISGLIHSFNSKCVYICIECRTVKCDDGRCLEVCE